MNNTRQALGDMFLRPEAVYVTDHKAEPIYMKVHCSNDNDLGYCVLLCSFTSDFSETWEADVIEIVTDDPAISYSKVM